MIKKVYTKQAVVKEWDLWVPKNLTREAKGSDGLSFFAYLQRERSWLLKFRVKGDKWQSVRGFLLEAGRVQD
jgi:hypothetical protein